MLYKISEVGQEIQSFFTDLREALADQVTQMLEAQLEREVKSWLYREHYQRRQSDDTPIGISSILALRLLFRCCVCIFPAHAIAVYAVDWIAACVAVAILS